MTATTFIRAIKFNLAVRDLLDGHPYLKLLPYARDLEELCKSIDKNNDGLITIDEVLLFARTLQERKKASIPMQIQTRMENDAMETNGNVNVEPSSQLGQKKNVAAIEVSSPEPAEGLKVNMEYDEVELKDDYPSTKIKIDIKRNEVPLNAPKSSAINDAIVDIFNCIDKDSNGVLEKREVLRAFVFDPAIIKKVHAFPSLEPFLLPSQFQSSFQKLQTKKDGRITLVEFTEFTKKNILNRNADEHSCI